MTQQPDREADGGEGDGTAPPRRRRRWGRRIVLTLLALVLLLALGVWGAGRRARKNLDDDLALYRDAGEPVTVEELNGWPALRSGEGENAVPLLRAAAASLDQASAAFKAAVDASHAPPFEDAEVRALEAVASANAEALAKLDEATARSRIDWDPQYRSPVMITLNAPPGDFTDQAALVQLLHAAALAAHARGDDAEALRRIGQMRFIAAALDHQPWLTGHLMAVGCHLRAARAAEHVAPGLRVGGDKGAAPPQAVRDLVAALLDERPLNDGLRRALVAERVFELDFPNGVLANTGRGGTFGGFNLRVPGMTFLVRPMVFDNARAMARYTTFVMETAEATTDLPAYRAALAATDPVPEVKAAPRRYGMAAVMMPSISRGVETHYRGLASRRLAATCVAARLYALDHDGNLPAKLDDLVPAYLPAVPLDPLAAGGTPLRYVNEHADSQHPRVYSVGPDGRDDGGPVPKDENKPADEVRVLKR